MTGSRPAEKHAADLDLRVERVLGEGGTDVLRIAGTLDLSTVPVLRAALEEVLADTPDTLRLDARAIEFMDSSGIAVLLQAAEVVAQVHLIDPSPAVRRVVTLAGLDAILVMTP